MKLTISAGQLADALAFVAPAIPRKSPIPILFGVLITATDSAVTVYATSYDTALRIELPAATDTAAGVVVREPGKALVPHGVLAALVGKMKGTIDVHLDERVFRIRSGASDYQLSTLPVAEYPDPVTDFASARQATIKAEYLRTALSQVTHAAARDNALPELTGVNLTPDPAGRVLWLECTDRYRLARVSMPCTDALPHAVVPAAHELVAVAKHFNTDTDQLDFDDLSIGVDGGALVMYDGRRGARLRLIDKPFPNLDRIIKAAEPRWVARIDRQELITTVDRIAVVSDSEKGAPIALSIWDDHIEISARSLSQDHNAVDVISTCKASPVDGEPTPAWPVLVGFQPHYLLDELKALDGDVVTLGADDTSGRRPFRIGGSSSLQVVLMPIRLPNQQ